MSTVARAELGGTQLFTTFGTQLPEGFNFLTRGSDFDVKIMIHGKRHRFPKILREISGYQREWLNDSTVKFIRATAIALVDNKVPERFARHIRQDLEDADFRRTPGDTVMAARIKKSARTRERANFVDVEGIRCFCLGVVPEFVLDNLRLAQNSEWMAASPEVVSLSDCRAVQHSKSSGSQQQPLRAPRRPLEEVLHTVDKEDWVWFRTAGKQPKPPATRPCNTDQPPTAQPQASEGLPATQLDVQPEKSHVERLTHAVKMVYVVLLAASQTAYEKMVHWPGFAHLSNASPRVALNQVVNLTREAALHSLHIKASTMVWVAVILIVFEFGRFNEAFSFLSSIFARLFHTIFFLTLSSLQGLRSFIFASTVSLFCRGLFFFADAIVWLQQTQLGQLIPVEKRIFFHQIHNLTRALEEY